MQSERRCIWSFGSIFAGHRTILHNQPMSYFFITIFKVGRESLFEIDFMEIQSSNFFLLLSIRNRTVRDNATE
jgi:hypothetical protein